MLFVKKSASFCTGRAEFNPSLSLSRLLSLSLSFSLSLKVEEAFFFKVIILTNQFKDVVFGKVPLI